MIGDDDSTASSSPVLVCEKETAIAVNWSVSDFTIFCELYSSGGTTIFKARENWSEELCVLKRICKLDSVRQHTTAQVERELLIHSHLRHENVIRMLSWFDDAQSIYLITEFAELTVADLLRDQYSSGIPDNLCRTMLSELMSGLAYLHSNHVIHRDLKPTNLFLKNSVLKIGDFGSCVHTLDMRKSLCGSVPYMSPEMVGSGVYSFPHDVWSLGVCLHEMLTGTLPFDGNSPMEIYRKIVKQEYLVSSTVSTDMVVFLKSCLVKDPGARFSLINKK